MHKTFYSNGKLLLTGEYVVLDGALSLAMPTSYGQSLTIEPKNNRFLYWESIDEQGKRWFEATIDLDELKLNIFNKVQTFQNKKNNALAKAITKTSDVEIAITLLKILIEAQKLNSIFLSGPEGYEITTKLTFNKDWGLGSSSTLINNIAQWATIDPYKLLQHTFSGSGYDIACAKHNTPITYQLVNKNPIVKEVRFDPLYKDRLFFVYLNKKQNSRDGIALYKNLRGSKLPYIKAVSKITEKLLVAKTLNDFESLIEQHEQVISKMLGFPTIKKSLFPDYNYGTIKSLGAWGGDFILATGNKNTLDYFYNKGFKTIVPYHKMFL
ncbi:GYDIA family GHMP kinase [Leptobacterium sp. I13]|uniref:GYDIA family GHMP kinase n=1 Tax=Leptobacterium meishanense TaxID=3128904 RepID=UPI0030EDD5AD